jgi:heptosyltransferase I
VSDAPKTLDPDKLLIVRTSAMGDIIHALPAVAALREALPESVIGWVVEERWVELLCAPSAALSGPRLPGRPMVDRVHVINTKSWRRSLLSLDTWKQIRGSTVDLRSGKYPVAIDFQGSLRSAFIARVSGANQIYGFAHPRERGAQIFYTNRAIAEGTHVIEQNNSLAESLIGSLITIPKAELPRDEGADQECDRYLREHQIEKFVLLNPGAGWGAKQWPADRCGAVAQELSKDGLHCLINYGPGEEALARAAESSSGGHARMIQLSLTQLISFTRRASLFIGGDTGPMHLAAASGIPVIALFGPTDPARNGPFGTKNIVLRSPLSLTSHKRRAEPDAGLLTITVDEVLSAARNLLRGANA